MKNKPKIIVTKRVKAILDHLCRTEEIKTEVGAFLFGEVNKNHILVNDLYVVHQTVNAVHVEMDVDAQVKMEQELGQEKMLELIGHFHKHPAAMCTPSVEDEQRTFGILSAEEGREFTCFIIGCKSTYMSQEVKYYARIECYNYGMPVTIETELEVESEDEFVEDIQKIMEDVRERVTEEPVVIIKQKKINWNGFKGYDKKKKHKDYYGFEDDLEYCNTIDRTLEEEI